MHDEKTNIEIERKFLVSSSAWKRLKKIDEYEIIQFYVTITKNTCTRFRICKNKAIYTHKVGTGIKRKEYEYQVPMDVATRQLSKCKTVPIKKVRSVVMFKGYQWEIDTFLDDNSGLIIAEIELKDEKVMIPLPSWVSKEVTTNKRYYNSHLAKKPYKTWKRL